MCASSSHACERAASSQRTAVYEAVLKQKRRSARIAITAQAVGEGCEGRDAMSEPTMQACGVSAASLARAKDTPKKRDPAVDLGGGLACLELSVSGSKLPNKDGFFGKSDPYYVLKRATESGGWQEVLRSEVVKNNLSPVWKTQLLLPFDKLGAGDALCPLKLEVWDEDRGADDFMCECALSGGTQALISAGRAQHKMIDPKKPAKARGTLTIGARLVQPRY